MDVLRFDRWDFLGTKVLLMLVAVVTPLVTVVLPVVTWLTGGALVWEGEVGSPAALQQPDVVALGGADLRWPGTATVSLPDADTAVWLASLLPGLVVSLTTVTVALLMSWLLRRIQRGDAFVAASVTVLRLVGLTLVVGSLVTRASSAIADASVQSSAVGTNPYVTVTLSLSAPLAFILVGLLVAAVAEAFAHGARLADDVAGLV